MSIHIKIQQMHINVIFDNVDKYKDFILLELKYMLAKMNLAISNKLFYRVTIKKLQGSRLLVIFLCFHLLHTKHYYSTVFISDNQYE